jgi:hypothetical protein
MAVSDLVALFRVWLLSLVNIRLHFDPVHHRPDDGMRSEKRTADEVKKLNEAIRAHGAKN